MIPQIPKPGRLRYVDDLSDGDVDHLLARAREFERQRNHSASCSQNGRLLGLVFLDASLRTRVGFTAAAARLGWQTALVSERRANERSVAETVSDTIRVISGMASVVVARLCQPIAMVADFCMAPLVNGGDAGPHAEHPTQALIDLFSIEEEVGPIGGCHVAICGDLRLRASRSLLRLLARRPPRRLSLISVPELTDDGDLAALGTPAAERRSLADLSDVDVLYVAGIPHKAIPEDLRGTLRVTGAVLSTMPPSGVVLSPLPVIDEIDDGARRDPRIRMFAQSDRAVSMRMAVLEHLVCGPGAR